jgi:hypothetical protein
MSIVREVVGAVVLRIARLEFRGERLALLARHLAGVRSAAALELEMFAYGVV